MILRTQCQGGVNGTIQRKRKRTMINHDKLACSWVACVFAVISWLQRRSPTSRGISPCCMSPSFWDEMFYENLRMNFVVPLYSGLEIFLSWKSQSRRDLFISSERLRHCTGGMAGLSAVYQDHIFAFNHWLYSQKPFTSSQSGFSD